MFRQNLAGWPGPTTRGGRWKTGFWTRLPFLGLSAIALVFACVVAAILILVRSDGRPIHEWSVQPTVWLAVASAIANVCLHYALAEGVAIAWWLKAVHGGTIQDLHNNWNFGNSLASALLSGRKFNLVALASIVSTLAIINGPLLQRASTVVSQAPKSTTELTVRISPHWDDIQSGWITGRGGLVSILSRNFVQVMQDYTNRVDIKVNYTTGCDATCSSTVRGAGFAVNCTEGQIPTDITVTGTESVGVKTTIFSTSFFSSSTGNSDSPAINMTVSYKNTTDCDVFPMTSKSCLLMPAVVEYPVVVTNNTISLTPPASSWHNDTVISYASLQFNSQSGSPTTLGGFVLAANNQFNSSAELSFGGAVSWIVQAIGSQPNIYAANDNRNCSISFSDPTFDLLAALREISFRTAIGAANSSTTQQVQADVTGIETVYKSRYLYLIIACAVMTMGAIVVLSIFHGWWELGRTVSLSPIETAKAFSAPILQGQNWNGDAKALLSEMGTREVKYGEVLVANGMPIPGHVAVPDTSLLERRLEIADPSWARPAVKGASY